MVINQRKKKNLQFWEERRRDNMGNKYISPGVFVKEVDISIVRPNLSKRYLRRIKIGKIFYIDVPNIIITTPIGQNNFTQTKIW